MLQSATERQKPSPKAQSAMEYLMTYGWAILIIAVVLGALFQLGVFNGATFAPKAPPGACQVFRPNGPSTAFDLNLEGVCNGELPEYVASFNANGAVNVIAPTQLPIGDSPRTIVAWVYPLGGNNNANGNQQVVFYGQSTTDEGVGLIIYPDSNNVYFEGWNDWNSGLIVTNNTWNFVAVTYSGGVSNTIGGYENNQSASGYLSAALATPSGTNLYVGFGGPATRYYKGYIANVQIYNASLSQPEVNALYLEGIGVAPIDLQNLVGWWPLNGDANDYSGNENNGVPTNVVYTSSWTSGYTTP